MINGKKIKRWIRTGNGRLPKNITKFSPGQNASTKQSLFGLASNIAALLSDTDQGISDSLIPENSETQIALEQESTYKKVS